MQYNPNLKYLRISEYISAIKIDFLKKLPLRYNLILEQIYLLHI